MNHAYRILASLVVLCCSAGVLFADSTLPDGFPDTERSKTSLTTSWRFHLGDPDALHHTSDLDDSSWDVVSIPHTLKLTDLNLDGCDDDKTQPTFHRTVGWYRRTIDVSKQAGKVFLEFEGAHQVTDLWVNGKHVGQHAIGGYTPFHFDITDFVERGGNKVALRVDNRRRDGVPPDPGPFDYVKFSGLYRDVYLVETAPLHVTFPWEDFYAGVFITTPTVDPLNNNATISIRTTVRNESDQVKACRLLTRVIDKEGVVVLRLLTEKVVRPGADWTMNQTGGIEENLHLWSCDDPYLYRVNTLVLDGDHVVDCIENPLGIRSIDLSKEEGFLLNGKPVQLVGKNRHQHYAYIGDAVPNALHYKDMLQFKQMGLNIVRTAHYPQDNALLDACDELGILVYEEAPTWISIGNDAWFDNLERAARRMVRNHRNHPSVLIWGGGINHRGYVPRLHYAVKEEDPTRWTGSNNAEWTGVQNSGVCDLFTNMDYGGIKDWSGKEYLLAMEGGSGESTLQKYASDPLRLGIIAWTGHAYYTFHIGPNQWNRMRSGSLDGFRTQSPPRDATSGEPVAMKLELDMEDRVLTADGSDIVIARTRFFDNKGNIVPKSELQVRYSVTGPASIVGDGLLKGVNPIGLSRGAAPALIRAMTEPGMITVRAECEGFDAQEVTVSSVPFNSDSIEASAKPIYDQEKVLVDLGEAGQLVQFDWTPWFGNRNEEALITLPNMGGFKVALKCGSKDGMTRWLGEANIKGFRNFAIGDGMCAVDEKGLLLQFSGLPKGRYQLKTYHHSPRSNTNSMDPNRERLKTLTIHQIPVAANVAIQVDGKRVVAGTTSGGQIPDSGPGAAIVTFEVQGDAPVTVTMTDADGDGAKAVWLNAFELQQASCVHQSN
ncbi:glycoside hydrolase family 2 protein [Novipirellula artificiosorum]|uniref:Beta-galactosidase n=1 Tax=Novipirellula artificiosorum TaxID=2528016 RepID=A0A5C6D5A8_9BACT|nr:glycoside hydrolase family 2 TIM barrel-domain containing protein [Novipirellula artificiosorum]TWU32040.1 Beta-galactosidase [Novipirellula artificiosorum]